MAQPLIGVTTSSVSREPERVQLNAAYVRAVEVGGGVPVLLPPQLSPAALGQLLLAVDGILLTGGGDIDPSRYGEPPHESLVYVSEERDTLEIAVVHAALERNLPVLALCRGMQVLNVALGGSLIQDIPSQFTTDINHSQSEPREEVTHEVAVQPGSRLRGLLGSDSIQVNSFHHQALKTLGAGLEAVAWAPDGIIEGIELPGDGFVVGVAWHPEDLVNSRNEARALFEGLVEATAARG